MRRHFLIRLKAEDDDTSLRDLFEYANDLDDDDRAKLQSIEVEWDRANQSFLLYALLLG